jgi:hypothetical protein
MTAITARLGSQPQWARLLLRIAGIVGLAKLLSLLLSDPAHAQGADGITSMAENIKTWLTGTFAKTIAVRGLCSNGTENLHKPSSRLSPVRVVMDITAQHAVYFGLVSPRLRVILEPAHHIGIEPQGNGFFARLVKTGTLCQSPILNRCLGNIRRVDVSVRHVH